MAYRKTVFVEVQEPIASYWPAGLSEVFEAEFASEAADTEAAD